MAVNGDAPDALGFLRAAIAANTAPISTTSSDPSSQADYNASLAQASYLIFNTQSAADGAQHTAIPLAQTTRFRSQREGDAPVDLRSIYFAWQHKDTSTGDYLAAVQQLRTDIEQAGKSDTVVQLAFAEKTELVTWLAGELDESEFIVSVNDTEAARRQAGEAALAAKGGEDVEMIDATDGAARRQEEERLREIYASERKLGDHNTVLRGNKIQDFGALRKYAEAFLVKMKQQQAVQRPQPALTNNPALRPPVKPTQSGRRPEPIILLSPSASSLLRMSNIKSFLVDGNYTPPESGSGANILHISRTLRTISSQPLRFILVESPDNFRPDYWNRVVAVFTTGQTWQFKNYKWQNPSDLFAHALGVYLGWKGEIVPDSVKGWGRGVLTVQIDKGPNRWRDREVVEDVWGAIEVRMKGMGWGKDMR